MLLVLLLGFSYCLSEDILGYGTKFGTELDGDSKKVVGGSLRFLFTWENETETVYFPSID